MRNRHQRLERLASLAERRRAELELVDEDRDLAVEEAYRRLASTMDRKHVRLLESDDRSERVERLRHEVAYRLVAEL